MRVRESAHGPLLADSLVRKAGMVRTEWHGLLFGIELAEVGMAVETAWRAAAAGVLVSQLGPVIRCSPPLDIPDELLEKGLAVLVKGVPDA